MNDSLILLNSIDGELLLFRQNGKFVRKIGKKGRGPGEYPNIFHFDVIRDTIYISAVGKRSFIRYTFDGTFCNEIQLKYEPVYFTSTADQKLTCYLKEEGKILVYNKSFDTPDTIVVEYGVTKGRYYYSFGDPSFMTYLQKTPSSLLFNDYQNDTVWNIAGNKKEPAYIIDLNNRLPRNKHIEFCKGDFNGWKNMAKSYELVHLIPFSSLMFIFQKNYFDGKPDLIYLNNTKTGEIRGFITSKIYDDIVGKQNLYPIFLSSKDYLLTYSDSKEKLKELKQNKENMKEIPSVSWLNQMKTVNEYDNPILTIIKIKKNLQ